MQSLQVNNQLELATWRSLLKPSKTGRGVSTNRLVEAIHQIWSISLSHCSGIGVILHAIFFAFINKGLILSFMAILTFAFGLLNMSIE